MNKMLPAPKLVAYVLDIDGKRVIIDANKCYIEARPEHCDGPVKVTLELPFDTGKGEYYEAVVLLDE